MDDTGHPSDPDIVPATGVDLPAPTAEESGDPRPGTASERTPAGVGTGGRVRRVPFDRTAVDLVGDALRVPVGLAPFRLPGAAVYQILVSGDEMKGRPAALLTLWPSLRRVDAVGGPATIVFTDVAHVDLVDGIEVMFRRTGGDYLIVARGGKLVVRA